MDKTQANDLFWLAGYLDGDGSINLNTFKKRGHNEVNPRIRFTSKDYTLLMSAAKILKENNVGCFVQSKKSRPIGKYENKGYVFDLTVGGLKRCYKLALLLDGKIKSDDKSVRLTLMIEYINSRFNNNKNHSPITDKELDIVNKFKQTKPQRLDTNPLDEGEGKVRTCMRV